MAAVTVSANNTRIAVATIATDTGTWGNDGGGGGVSDEPDIVYQTGTAQSRKVSTSIIGRSYTHGSGTDMDGTPASTAHCIMKINATNSAALLSRTSPALHLKVGSSSGNYHTYWLFGNDNYPPRGGWQIVAIAPSVSGYAAEATDTGSPNDSSILYWSLLGDFSATSKAENVVIDAIDVGLGLALVGGDGASTDGVFADFVAHDEGTSANRYGYVYTEGGVLFVTGQLAIGQNSSGTSTITTFIDSGATLVWTNGLVTTGFHRLLIDLATSGTDVDLTNCSLNSLGQIDNDGDRGYTTTEDSRPIFEVTGSTGTLDVTGTVFAHFASFILNSACTFTGCTFTDCGEIDAGSGAQLVNCTASGYTGAADSSQIIWDVNLDPDGDLDGMNITKGSLAHHAIEFGTNAPLTMTLTDWTTSGFHASDGNNDSTLYFADRGSDVTWTVNVVGGTGNFSFKKARSGDTVNIVISPVTTLIKVTDETAANLQNARVRLEAGNGSGDLPYLDSVTITHVTTTASVSHTAHGMDAGDKVVIRGADQAAYNGVFAISNVTTNAYDYTMGSNPGTNATGTITASGVVLEGLTNASGEISASASYTTSQAVIGTIRKATSSPYYKPFDFTDTISNTAGLTKTVQMTRDD